MSAKPIRTPVDGAPFQPGDVVRVTTIVDPELHDHLPAFVGRSGRVDYLDFSGGCGQSYPSDPMIGVRFDDGAAADFWSEELAAA